MQSDNRARVFAAEEESEKQRDRLAIMQRELADVQQKIANHESDLARLNREVAELEAGIAAIVAVRTGKAVSVAAPSSAPRNTRPAAPKPKAQPKAQRAKKVFLHPHHSWRPAERMRIFDIMQAQITPGSIEEAAISLGHEYDVTVGSILNQWRDEQARRGLR